MWADHKKQAKHGQAGLSGLCASGSMGLGKKNWPMCRGEKINRKVKGSEITRPKSVR